MAFRRFISATGAALAAASGAGGASQEARTESQGFRLEALVDFADDALATTFMATHVDAGHDRRRLFEDRVLGMGGSVLCL